MCKANEKGLCWIKEIDVKNNNYFLLFRLKAIFVAGEHCDYETKAWAEKTFKVPILNHWWQTETGHAVTCTCLGLGHTTNPPKYSTGMPIPGYNCNCITNYNYLKETN